MSNGEEFYDRLYALISTAMPEGCAVALAIFDEDKHVHVTIGGLRERDPAYATMALTISSDVCNMLCDRVGGTRVEAMDEIDAVREAMAWPFPTGEKH